MKNLQRVGDKASKRALMSNRSERKTRKTHKDVVKTKNTKWILPKFSENVLYILIKEVMKNEHPTIRMC